MSNSGRNPRTRTVLTKRAAARRISVLVASLCVALGVLTVIVNTYSERRWIDVARWPGEHR
jgi:hypothetical protein